MKQFENVRIKKPTKSVFDLSHERKMSMNMGDLVPCFVSEVIPGDNFRLNMEMLVRMQPLIAPVMHRMNVSTHFFFVPYRLVWDAWEEFITGKVATMPMIKGLESGFHLSALVNNGTLADYLGIPVTRYKEMDDVLLDAIPFSQIPFRAYQLIYNEYFRDQNLITEITNYKGSDDYDIEDSEATDLMTIRKRCWEKDYFTSALPTAQRGTPVLFPLVGDAPVAGKLRVSTYGHTAPADGDIRVDNSIDDTIEDANGVPLAVFPTGDGLRVDLTGATSTTVNDMRTAYAIQRWLEKSMRFGQRYIEQLLGVFGVRSRDSRLQRPEYLGGGKMPLTISEVLQNSPPNADYETPQGNMAGHGVTAGNINGFSRYFDEHGIIIGIMSIMPRTAYSQGLPKLFFKASPYEFLTPDFAHIGEEPVYNKELYLCDKLDEMNVFGYQPRYTDYRYMNDTIHGDFRDNLSYWHMARKFSAAPCLDETFVTANPTSEIFAVEDPAFHKILVQSYAHCKVSRSLPYWGEPMP